MPKKIPLTEDDVAVVKREIEEIFDRILRIDGLLSSSFRADVEPRSQWTKLVADFQPLRKKVPAAMQKEFIDQQSLRKPIVRTK
jgi:hypothetical protein